MISQGAKLEVECDAGYTVVGPSFIYCNEFMEWNDVLRGCQGNFLKYIHVIIVP